jgi:hypothetical protein
MPYPDSEYPSITRGKDKRESQRLLAAAPEMLTAARAALADMEGIMPEFDCDGDRQHPGWQTIAELRAAIAKAEGRE